jgi:uncharacterized protein
MNNLRPYDVEFVKLKEGTHQFDFDIDNTFFETYQSSLSTEKLEVKLLFTKSNNMFNLQFDVNGKVNVECDRCLNEIALPISNTQLLIVKVTEFAPEEDENDLIYISPSDYKLNVAQHIYDAILLSIPIKKTCADANESCDTRITSKITGEIDVELEIDPGQDTDNEEEDNIN